VFSLEEMVRPRKDENYEPKIPANFRLPKELAKRLKTAVRRKKARSANAYVEAALAERLDKDGIK
jgi:predicted HicB family RNase H-like nuclease